MNYQNLHRIWTTSINAGLPELHEGLQEGFSEGLPKAIHPESLPEGLPKGLSFLKACLTANERPPWGPIDFCQ